MLGFHAHAARLFSMKGFSIVALVLVGAVSGQGWPAQHEASSDTQPNIEVRLAPPARPLPEVAAEIALLESSRGSLEEAAFGKLQAAYNRALQDAKAKIGDVVGRATQTAVEGEGFRATEHAISFLQAGRDTTAGQPSVRVTVLPVSPPDPALRGGIDAIEEKRSALEAQLFEQATTEVGDLTAVILAELEAQLQPHARSVLSKARVAPAPPHAPRTGPASFTEVETGQTGGLPEGLNIRVGASDVPYPTVAGLVRDMELRRDASESLIRQRVLEMLMQLSKAENGMIKEALRRAVTEVLAQRTPAP